MASLEDALSSAAGSGVVPHAASRGPFALVQQVVPANVRGDEPTCPYQRRGRPLRGGGSGQARGGCGSTQSLADPASETK